MECRLTVRTPSGREILFLFRRRGICGSTYLEILRGNLNMDMRLNLGSPVLLFREGCLGSYWVKTIFLEGRSVSLEELTEKKDVEDGTPLDIETAVCLVCLGRIVCSPPPVPVFQLPLFYFEVF